VTSEERTERITVRLAPSEVEMLRALAELDGVSVADALRMAVRRAHAERVNGNAPKKPKR
jgi:hypothetical protein